MKTKLVTLALAAVLLASCSPATTKTGIANLVNEGEFAKISTSDASLHSLLAVDMSSALPLLDSSTALMAPSLRKAESTSVTSDTSSSTASSAENTNASTKTSSSVTTPSTSTEDPIAELLSSLDLFMAGDINFTSKEVPSALKDYAYQLDVKYALLDGTSVDYSLNYNSVKQEQEISEDETELEVTITGVSIIEDTTYAFTLVSETETSKNEQESEVKFHLEKDAKNFVEIKNSLEVEDNEKELKYSYRQVADGVEVNAYKLSFENEDEDKEDETKLVTATKVYTIETEVKDQRTLVDVKEKDLATGTETKYVYERIVTAVNGEAVTRCVVYQA